MTNPAGPEESAQDASQSRLAAPLISSPNAAGSHSATAPRLTAEEAVERGTRLLTLLSHQAAAARAEAQRDELSLLLSEARDGHTLRLQRWLDSHSPDMLHVHQPLGTAGLSARLPDGWDSLREPARARLAKQVKQLEAPTTLVSLPTEGVEQADVGVEQAEGSVEQNVRPEVHNIAHQFAPEHRHDLQAQHQRQVRLSRLRGVLASILAHGLLVLVLAWVTLSLPTPPASLGLEATPVEWAPTDLEVSQPLEVNSPDAAENSIPNAEAFDLSKTLTDGTAHVDLAIGQLSSSTSSVLPNQNLLAAASAASRLMKSDATFFGASASGNCFCYVIDGSGSMRNGPWDAAKFELLKSLSTLKEKQRFYIIFFNRELSAIPLPGEQTPAATALYATPDNLAHTRRWLDTLRIGIGGPPNDALSMAIDKEPDAIYLLTDGVTNVDVPKYLRERNRVQDLIGGEQVRVPIHTIAFYSADGQALLKQVAAENDGQFIYVPDPRRK